MSGWLSKSCNVKEDFRDEFAASDRWDENTHACIPWLSYGCYLSFFVVIPTTRLFVFSWAIGGYVTLYYIFMVLCGLLLASLVHVVATWQQMCLKLVFCTFLCAPLLSGIALVG